MMHSLPLALSFILVVSFASGASGTENSTKIRETVTALDPCIIQSIYSFLIPESHPPTTIDALKKSCKTQSDGFRCLRDKSKTAPALLKRGVATFTQNRQRHHRKYCSNVNSDQSKQFVSDIKCIMDKQLSVYKTIDTEYALSMQELVRRNYNDSAIELKYLCCTIFKYRRAILDNVGVECASSKPRMEEMMLSIVSNDLSLICEDEDKMISKVCPKLEPMKLAKVIGTPKPGPAASTLYLIATLGEAE